MTTKIKVESQSASWLMGFSAVKNGANERNTNFKYFSTEASMKEWEAGKKAGELEKSKVKN